MPETTELAAITARQRELVVDLRIKHSLGSLGFFGLEGRHRRQCHRYSPLTVLRIDQRKRNLSGYVCT